MITLTNLGGGAAVERFNYELNRVLQNIHDPNTPAQAVRTITLTVKLTPDETREIADTSISCSSKVAPFRDFPTRIFMRKVGDEVIARENADPSQIGLFSEATTETVKTKAGEKHVG